MTQRTGVTVVELLLAVALTGLLATAALCVLRDTSRAVGHVAMRDRAAAVAEEALGVVGTMVEAAVDVTVLGDTALEVISLVVDGIPCGDGTLARLDAAGRVPASGDRWEMLERVVAADGADSLRWQTVSAMPLLAEGTGCALPDASRLLIRVTTRTRLVPYQSADGAWMLGLRRCLDRCEAAQPLAGPIHPPADGGWQLAAAPCGVEVGVRPIGMPAARWRLARRC